MHSDRLPFPANLPPEYQLRVGSPWERATLVKFAQKTYRELFPEQANFQHLADTVARHLSSQTPLWWVIPASSGKSADRSQLRPELPIACLWMGNGIDQVSGDRYAHIFLLYVTPEHRRQGIGTALMQRAQDWAKARGDRQIGLHVFAHNQPAIDLYQRLGYRPQALQFMKEL